MCEKAANFRAVTEKHTQGVEFLYLISWSEAALKIQTAVSCQNLFCFPSNWLPSYPTSLKKKKNRKCTFILGRCKQAKREGTIVNVCVVLSLCILLTHNGSGCSVCQCPFAHKWSGELHAPGGAARLYLRCQSSLAATRRTQPSLGSNWPPPFRHNSFILGRLLPLFSSKTLPACRKVIDFSGCQFRQTGDVGFFLFALCGERCIRPQLNKSSCLGSADVGCTSGLPEALKNAVW